MNNILNAFNKIAENEGITVTKLEQILGASKGVLTRAIAKDSDIQSKWILSLVENYPQYNTDWLLTGKGEMLKDQTDDQVKSAKATGIYMSKTDRLKSLQQIPVFDIHAAASLVSVFADKPNIIDYIHVPNLPNCDGAITITGDSMYPLIKSGDLVAYKQQPVEYESIVFGEMYLLSYVDHGDTFIMVKYLQKSEKGEDYIKLVSQNQNHHSRDIKLKKINALALIKATIRYHSMS